VDATPAGDRHPSELGAMLTRAVELAAENVRGGQRPYAALVVKDTTVIGQGVNIVLATGDPTAHAEVEAVRDTCRTLGVRTLGGAYLVASCQPCPMCQAVTRLVGIERIYYAGSCESRSSVVLSEPQTQLVPVADAARPFELAREANLVMVDDPAG
jgi:guanine deaminase